MEAEMGMHGTGGNTRDGSKPKDQHGTFVDPTKQPSKGKRAKDDEGKGGKGK
ncbi:hypothetical protein Acsp04_23300 [Actinomadura sp. NBRC 104425]|uniref:hypothetical protein n=1 Tax=Actinomadura sp. NBRC 104425 TaxID=3032204 RepID=UPI0024A3F623|nr:hypothetical protein [Actinomadura sp. NBRC 104425]GLZ12095.1 hypothetical protein Acsp04_23300 [Actinomadura sp. NBRC 104425]